MSGNENLLMRLYRTQLAYFGTVLTLAGWGILFLAQVPAIRTLEWLPLKDFGSAVLIAGVFSTAWDARRARDTEDRTDARLEEIIDRKIPEIVEAVVTGIAASPELLLRVLSPQAVNSHALHTLTARFGDDAPIAHAEYATLTRRLSVTPQRHYDTHVSITVRAWDNPDAEQPMFMVTQRWEYRANVPATQEFWCVPDYARYRRLRTHPDVVQVWQFEDVDSIHARDAATFELLNYSRNGVNLPINTTTHGDSQVYSVTSNNVQSSTLDTISYTFQGLLPQVGHLLTLDFDTPTHGANIEFSYQGSGIRRVNVSPHLGGEPYWYHSEPGSPAVVALRYEDWIWPSSGVTYTWILNHE